MRGGKTSGGREREREREDLCVCVFFFLGGGGEKHDCLLIFVVSLYI